METPIVLPFLQKMVDRYHQLFVIPCSMSPKLALADFFAEQVFCLAVHVALLVATDGISRSIIR